MTISIDDLLNTHGMGTSGNQNTGRLIPKTARLVVKQPTANVVLPPELAYDATRDILIIYINQRALAKDVEYSILSDGKTIQRKGGNFDAGSVLDFLVVTNIKTDIPTFDGSLLAEGSVVESKLAKEVRDKLAATLGMDKVRDDIEQLESKTRMMREVSANTQLLTEAGDLIASGTTYGGNGMYEFGNKPDLTGTKTKVALPVGTTLLAGKVDTVAFPTYTYVTIYDDVNNEDVLVTNGLAGELAITPTRFAYKVGAVIKRSTMIPVAAGKGYTFPTWNGNPVNRGTLRIAQGWTDEVVLWATHNDDLQTRVKMSYLGEDDKDVIGTKRAGTELVSTSKVTDVASVDLSKSDNLTSGHVITELYRYDLDPATFADFAVDSKKNVYTVYKSVAGRKLLKKNDFWGKELWVNTELGNPFLVEVAPDDSVYVVYDLPVGQKMIRRFSPTGVELWNMVRTASHATPVKLQVCPNGDIVVGFSNTTGPSLRRYSTTGALLWEYAIAGIRDLGVDPAGFVTVLKTGGDLYRLKPDGQLHWTTPTTLYQNESMMVVDTQGNIIVGYYCKKDMYEFFGKSISVDKTAPDRLIKKYNSNGTLLWDVDPNAGFFYQYKSATVSENPNPESVRTLAVDTEGNITVGMLQPYDGRYNANFIKFDANGKIMLLNQRIDKDRYFNKIRITPDGYTFFLQKPSNEAYGFFDHEYGFISSNISVSGRDFTKIFEQPQDMTLGSAVFHAFDSKNNAYVVRRNSYTEFEPAPVSGDSYLVKYDKDGREIWRKRYTYTVHQVCVDEFDHIYIATSGSDSVIKMDTDGTRIWGKDFYRNAFAIAPIPGGGVFVGYEYCVYQKIDKNGSAFAKYDAQKGQGFTYHTGATKFYQPRSLIVNSKGRCIALKWPSRLDAFTATLQSENTVSSEMPGGLGQLTHVDTGNPYLGFTYQTLPKFYPMQSMAFDRNDNLIHVFPGVVVKYDASYKPLWARHIGMSNELQDGYPPNLTTVAGVAPDGTIYASSSRGLRTLDQDGRLTGLYGVDANRIAIDNAGDVYFPDFYYSKYGKFPKARTWTLIEDNKSWFIRTTKSTTAKMTIRIQSGDKITSEVVTLNPNENFRYALLPENFLEGLNIVRFSFDNDGYEEWQVTRTSESLAVTQFLATTEDVKFTDMTLEVRREAGSRSIVHKYLGGIG